MGTLWADDSLSASLLFLPSRALSDNSNELQAPEVLRGLFYTRQKPVRGFARWCSLIASLRPSAVSSLSSCTLKAEEARPATSDCG